MILPLLINTFISLPNRQLSIRIATLKYGLSTEAILNEIKYQSHTVLKCPLTSIGPSSDQHTLLYKQYTITVQLLLKVYIQVLYPKTEFWVTWYEV